MMRELSAKQLTDALDEASATTPLPPSRKL